MLEAAAGRANRDIAAELGCHPATVSKWRKRFAQQRLDGIADDPLPGPSRKITDRGNQMLCASNVIGVVTIVLTRSNS